MKVRKSQEHGGKFSGQVFSQIEQYMYNMWFINSQLSYLIKPNETKIRQNNDKNMIKCDKLKWGKDLKNFYIGHMITK